MTETSEQYVALWKKLVRMLRNWLRRTPDRKHRRRPFLDLP